MRRLAGSFTVWLGRGDPVRAGAPVATLAELIRASIEPDLAPDRAAPAELAARRGVGEPSRVAAFLAELLGLPDDGAPDAQVAAARANPILMNDQLRRAVVDW